MEYWSAFTSYYTPDAADAWLGASSGAAHWRAGHLPDSPTREVYSVADRDSARVWSIEENEVCCNLLNTLILVDKFEMGTN